MAEADGGKSGLIWAIMLWLGRASLDDARSGIEDGWRKADAITAAIPEYSSHS
ncbi:MAG: hypothetical protein WCF85_19435 [Rhodospirillaceae bacterium]